MLGSIRLQEMLATSAETPQRSAQMLRQEIAKVIAVNRDTLGLQGIRTFIATGADARFAAAQVGEPMERGRPGPRGQGRPGQTRPPQRGRRRPSNWPGGTAWRFRRPRR